MIKIEKVKVTGIEEAIRGMRNPMNSWKKSDSIFCRRGECEFCPMKSDCGSTDLDFDIGPNDHNLMLKLAKVGPVHAKYRRMIIVYLDITAPLYWWKEFDTYKVGTVVNSCSTMHKIHEKEFTLDDFSCEHLIGNDDFRLDNFESMLYVDRDNGKHIFALNTGEFGDTCEGIYLNSPIDDLKYTIGKLNLCRRLFLDESIKSDRKIYWWQMIQLLPSSYNQKRTVMLNYEVLAGIYKHRCKHKLDEWREFCKWIEKLPYSEIIMLGGI